MYNMSMEDPNGATFAGIGGLSDQIRELREVRRVPLACGKCVHSSSAGHRASPHEPRALPPSRHQASEGYARFLSPHERLANRTAQVFCFTVPQERARPFSHAPSPRRSRPTSSRSSRPPSSTSTLARVHASFARCLATPRSTSLASSSWTRSMRLEEGGSARARRRTGRFRGL